jgi:sterol desaturase/sphingolipid hydroxylase (fatty acid hydroxylase superfamily)
MDSIANLSPLAQFAIMMGVNFALIGILMEAMKAAFHWPALAKHRVRQELPRKVDKKEHKRTTIINSFSSTSMFLFFTFVFFDSLFYIDGATWGRMAFEVSAMLLFYDFLYYLLHRYIYHEWEVGRKWHSVHHRIRTPKTKDSLYTHPMETILGVCAMWVSIVATGLLAGYVFGGPGGMHIFAFGVGFFIYSVINLYIHSAVLIPVFPLNLLFALSKNHDAHHTSMRGGYYASITPFWDIVLKTNRANVPPRNKNPRPDA